MVLHLTLAVEQWKPYVGIKHREDATIEVTGQMKPILDVLSTYVPFSYDLVLPFPRGLWGVKQANGHFSGMFGMLENKTVDMILSPAVISNTRNEIADYLFPFVYDFYTMVYPIPKMSSDSMGFLKPYTAMAWLLILLTFGMVTMTVFLATRVEGRSPNRKEPLSTICISMIGYLSLQGVANISTRKISRLLIALWAILSFILAKSYEGTLIAILTSPDVHIPINSIEDLVNQRKQSWRIENSSTLYARFEISNFPLERRLFDEKNGTFNDCATNRSEIVNGQFIGICDWITVKYIMHKEFSSNGKCTLYSPQTPIVSFALLSIALVKKSPHYERINLVFMRLYESGIIAKLEENESKNATYCINLRTTLSKPTIVLDMGKFSGIFLFLVIGLTLSAIVFVLELTIGYI